MACASPGDQRGQRPDGGDQTEPGVQQRASDRRPLEVALLALALRRSHDGHQVAGEQRPAECQEQPLEKVLAEEHRPIMPGRRAGHARGRNTACVCVVLATSLPSAVRSSVSTTIVVAPRCSGVAVAVIEAPSRTPPRKFVFDSIVDVPLAPSGRLRNADAAPAESASAISTPPCSKPALVQRAACQSRWSTTRSGANSDAVMPN